MDRGRAFAGRCIAFLVTAAVFLFLIALSGVFFDDAAARGAYAVLKDWQVLIVGFALLLAAFWAATPAWEQLAELRRQSARQAYESLRRRSTELQSERLAVFELTSSIQIAADAMADFRERDTAAEIRSSSIGPLAGARDCLRSDIGRFQRDLGPVWGDAAVQMARRQLLDAACRVAGILEPLTQRLQPDGRLSDAEIDGAVEQLAAHQVIAIAAAQRLHDAIESETGRVGAALTELERRALP